MGQLLVKYTQMLKSSPWNSPPTSSEVLFSAIDSEEDPLEPHESMQWSDPNSPRLIRRRRRGAVHVLSISRHEPRLDRERCPDGFVKAVEEVCVYSGQATVALMHAIWHVQSQLLEVKYM